ncbi:LPS export ABC transporter permease LptG [Alysiella filiformis]|uniref:Lipopolysaccharide export system permease protein n=1 Tax=Alysiella filiformis DSM 16848 TaxID=1120981 RepID=A0A286EEH4_9NEIS|nr:LPS export ABC transporter permease LptG [Alysiella filiformis]QMT31634.1 LPS export ABC transporter permease LptG [Alysiella filiformis]UBQ55355.1 LPS export ABC transporter permease LptG [Alysiella filiformis DSM 16848]SOD69307.1 lipopolysaccharide export system permease protein [Alysiella filiformis DSM 16848]
MKLITRYLITRLSVMSLYALLSILALYSFIDFLSEVGNIGEGNYTIWTALQYMFMQMPARAYQLMPLATLIGGLVALSQLSANSELAVIKTSGLSTTQIIGMIGKFSAIFAVATILLGEWLAPQFSRQADALKSTAKTGQIATTQTGVWVKQANSMVNVSSMLPDNTLVGVKIWQYNEQFKLTEALFAEKAQVSDGKWILHNVKSSVLGENRVQTVHEPQREWATPVGNQLLDVLLVKPEQMSFTALTRYIGYLKENRQQTQAYDVAWWNKLVYPIATMVMALVALAFTPNSGRHSNMGLKLFGGICLGLLFFFTGRLFGFTSQLYGVPAFLSAVLPTAAFAIWAIYLIRKHEIR